LLTTEECAQLTGGVWVKGRRRRILEEVVWAASLTPKVVERRVLDGTFIWDVVQARRLAAATDVVEQGSHRHGPKPIWDGHQDRGLEAAGEGSDPGRRLLDRRLTIVRATSRRPGDHSGAELRRSIADARAG
jgi:hypothetical protein